GVEASRLAVGSGRVHAVGRFTDTWLRLVAHYVPPSQSCGIPYRYIPCGSAETDLLASLHRYWGYSAFRPMQERIVGSLLSGHDTCVVMPTGGGKSLCYQLPALALGKTAVVVSPLIALMQDQAAQLAQMGIPAAV